MLLFADMDEPKRKEVDGDEFQAMYWTGDGRPAGPARSVIHRNNGPPPKSHLLGRLPAQPDEYQSKWRDPGEAIAFSILYSPARPSQSNILTHRPAAVRPMMLAVRPMGHKLSTGLAISVRRLIDWTARSTG